MFRPRVAIPGHHSAFGRRFKPASMNCRIRPDRPPHDDAGSRTGCSSVDRHPLHSRRWQRRCRCAAARRVAGPLDSRSVLRRWRIASRRPGPAPMASARGTHGSKDKAPTARLGPGLSAGAFLCSCTPARRSRTVSTVCPTCPIVACHDIGSCGRPISFATGSDKPFAAPFP